MVCRHVQARASQLHAAEELLWLTLPPSATKASSVSASSWFLAVAALCLRMTLQNSEKSISPLLSSSTYNVCAAQSQGSQHARCCAWCPVPAAGPHLVHDGKQLLI